MSVECKRLKTSLTLLKVVSVSQTSNRGRLSRWCLS